MAEIDPAAARARVFLVVVDDTEEMPVALYYASRRASRTGGRVALLYVVETDGFRGGLLSVETLMREEARADAERLMQRLAADIVGTTGTLPVLHVREGNTSEELLALIAEDSSISVLVLGASTGPDGPGPLITYLMTKAVGRLPIPVTIVPGGLSREVLDAIT